MYVKKMGRYNVYVFKLHPPNGWILISSITHLKKDINFLMTVAKAC